LYFMMIFLYQKIKARFLCLHTFFVHPMAI
jgi:hypothetical protein